MKASDLRIGNYVMTSEEDVIMGIKLNMIETRLHPELLYDYFSPIPLTPEWLERFGFISGGDGRSNNYFYHENQHHVVEKNQSYFYRVPGVTLS